MLPTQVRAAETIYANIGPAERTISVDSLEIFVEEGQLPDDLKMFNRVLEPDVLEQIRQLLKQPINTNVVEASQLTYSPLGEDFLRRLGTIIQTEAGQNGLYAMRSAIILAADEPDGLTLLNVLRYFPTEGIRIDIAETLTVGQELFALTRVRDGALEAIARQAEQEAASGVDFEFALSSDLRNLGQYSVEQQVLTVTDTTRSSPLNAEERQFSVDLYLPQQTTQPAPVIAISHGLGAQRSEFRVLAEHLASYGFAVFVPEHVGSNTELAELRRSGNSFGKPSAAEFIDRPQDISFVLDELERLSQRDPNLRNRLALNQVGVIGHSLGGYTALALAAGQINDTHQNETCSNNSPTLNLSLILQCQAIDLPPDPTNVQDPRIVAVMALNPVSSTILGPESLSQIEVPVMMVQASEDVLAPMVPEQLIPFSWLTTSQKYLVTLFSGGHGSANQTQPFEENLATTVLTGPNTDLGSRYTRALSVAFMQMYVNDQPLYEPYLSAAYAAYMSEETLNVELITSPVDIPRDRSAFSR
ncbi:MAG: alpha/beta fold hydrolase [Cyanobacteria bacterium P01_A01_bin.37]